MAGPEAVARPLERIVGAMELAVAEEKPTAVSKEAAAAMKVINQLEGNPEILEFNISDFPFACWMEHVPGIIETITFRDSGAQAVKKLDMSGCGLPKGMAGPLWDMVAATKALSHVRLYESGLTYVHGEAIAKALKKAGNGVQTLDLTGNELMDEGAKKVARALEKNFTLKTLKLGYNRIGPAGCSRLALALGEGSPDFTKEQQKVGGRMKVKVTTNIMKNRSLTSLHLEGNPIGRQGVEGICNALAVNESLKVLNLAECEVEDTAGLLIANALSKNSGLTDLSLMNNTLTQFSVVRIAAALEKNTSLTYLDLWGNNLGEMGRQALDEAMDKNTTLKEVTRFET